MRFIQLVREKSPDVQPWLYAEWVEKDRTRPSNKGIVPSYEMKKTFPALTWQESMGAMLLYNEEVQHRIIVRNAGGKAPRIMVPLHARRHDANAHARVCVLWNH